MGKKRRTVKNELILLCVIHDKIKYCTLPNLEKYHQNKKLKNDTGYARPYSVKNLNLGLVPRTHIHPRCKVVSV